jgi:hypothetical protein
VPICRAPGKNIQAKSANSFIEFEVDNLKIGYSSYWNNYWKPIHPKQLRSLCGTYYLEPRTLFKMATIDIQRHKVLLHLQGNNSNC